MTAAATAIEQWLRRAEEYPRAWLAVAVLLPALQIRALWYATPDGVAYLSIARRLVAGVAPLRLGEAQLGYPLGYPLLISPAFWSGDRPWLALALLHWALAALFLVGVQRWARQRLGSAGVWVTLLVAANVNVWILYRRTLSEAAFCAVMIWTVVAFDRWLEALAAGERPRGAWLAAVPLLLLLIAIREVGLLFAIGFAVAAAARAGRGVLTWRAAAPALWAVGAVGGLALGIIRPERLAAAGPVFAGRARDYADAALAVGDTLGARLHLRMTEIGQLLLPGMFKAYGDGWWDINTLLYAPLLLVVGIGWWRLWRRQADVFTASAPLYLALYLAWPYAGGPRYLLPLLPLLWAATWLAVAALPYRRAAFALSAVAHLAVALGYLTLIDAPRARACAAQWPSVERVAAHVAVGGAAAAVEVPDCVRLMLELALDRPVGAQRAAAPVSADVAWLLAPRDVALAEPFAVELAAGDYVVARRR